MSIAWSAKLTSDELARVVDIAHEIGCQPDWLMSCMAFETGRTFSPSVHNPASSATGLIQFMRDTAIELGTTVEALARMTVLEQLEFVRLYFLLQVKRHGPLQSLADAYMAVLWPSAIGRPDEAVIFPAGSRAFLVNKGLDLDHDGEVTKAEAASKVAALLTEGYLPQNTRDAPIEDQSVDADPATIERIRAQEEPAMADSSPGIRAALTGIATAINPIAGLAVGLAGSLIDAFSPLAREKIQKELARHTDSTVAGQVADNLIGAAKALTGKTDAIAATAAAMNDPAILAQLEQQTLDHISSLAPILQKVQEWESAARAADEASFAAAAERAKGDGNDMTMTLVYGAIAFVAFILVGLTGGMVAQAWNTPDHKVQGELLALFANIVMLLIGVLVAIYQYRFGTSRSSAAKDAVIGELANRKRP